MKWASKVGRLEWKGDAAVAINQIIVLWNEDVPRRNTAITLSCTILSTISTCCRRTFFLRYYPRSHTCEIQSAIYLMVTDASKIGEDQTFWNDRDKPKCSNVYNKLRSYWKLKTCKCSVQKIISYILLLKYWSRLNPLQTKRRLLYLKTHSVPRHKHFSSQIIIVQSNTSFIIKYFYIGYMFRLIGAIIRPLPEHRSKFCTIGIPKVYI